MVKDHTLYREDGTRTPISEMSDAEINDHLECGVEIIEHATITKEDVEDRLRLELFIRERGLRFEIIGRR